MLTEKWKEAGNQTNEGFQKTAMAFAGSLVDTVFLRRNQYYV